MIAVDDLREIEQLLYRFCAGVDRQDWDLLASCYHPDAVDDHGEVTGPASEFLAWVRRRHERVRQSFHAVTNVRVVDQRLDAAVTETLCMGPPDTRASGRRAASVVGGLSVSRPVPPP